MLIRRKYWMYKRNLIVFLIFLLISICFNSAEMLGTTLLGEFLILYFMYALYDCFPSVRNFMDEFIV